MLPLHIGLLVETRYRAQLQPCGLAAALERAGHALSVVDPQLSVARLDDDAAVAGCDVVVARGRSWEVLCLLALAEAHGIPTVNRRSAIAAVHNKADMAVALGSAGIATPGTFVGSRASLATACEDVDAFPVVIKPIFGDNGAGIAVARTPRELQALPLAEPSLVQTLVRGTCEVKVYGVGNDVWMVRRPARFAPISILRPAIDSRPRPATDEYRDLAHRCQALFGLDAYGIDCIDTSGGPVVIEVNEFPNYTGIAEASDRLADLVVRRATTEQYVRRAPCA